MSKDFLGFVPTLTYLRTLRLATRYLEPRKFRNGQLRRSTITGAAYSLKPFDDTKSIFVHIPKCAGISVSKALYGNLAGGHTTLYEYLRIFEPEAVLAYFKFSVVRNPWDRLVSAYHFLKAGGMTSADSTWADTELAPYDDFDSFVRQWLNRRNIWKWYHFRPQYHYLTDPLGKIRMDFLGRFENLQEDFHRISARIGSAAELQEANVGRHDLYADYYCKATEAIVGDVYARDIAQFRYTFRAYKTVPSQPSEAVAPTTV